MNLLAVVAAPSRLPGVRKAEFSRARCNAVESPR